ncbi:MAG TPA: glycosyltransferase family 39 protein [Polyangiales bacterium]|nr:glycosyltransferase family 39 protein [Polyangiales bacterium]
MSVVTPPAHVGWRDHLVGALIGIAYVAVLLATSSELAMSRDESFYVVAAEDYGNWYADLFTDPERALEQKSIDRHWSFNNEHPALMKTFFAWSWLLDQRGWPALREAVGLERDTLFSVPSMAYRFPGMVSAGLILWLIYIFGARAADRRLGIFAALAYATLPRPFYHAHLDCFDVPIVLMVLWVTYCYWRSLVRKRWAIWTGVAYGCALATKHNAWIVPGVLLVHYAWVLGQELVRRKRGERERVILTPYWLIAMVILGPLIFIGSWPWIWHDTVPRFLGYARFHLHHDYYNMEYFGVNYFRPPFPTSYAFVMTLFTVPLTIVVLMVFGVALRVRALMPEKVADWLMPRGELRADARATDVLWFGQAIVPLLVIAMPGTPIFGGTKHWFTAYPFLCLFAGFAALHVLVSAESRLISRGLAEAWPVSALSMAVLLAPGFAETAHSHRFGLSHYTLAAGGVPGAADYGMNRQFWGFTTGSVVDFLVSKMPNGGSVYLADTTFTAFEMLKRDGRLPPNIRAEGRISEADYVLVHHEHHMNELDFQSWMAHGGAVQPVHVLTYDGVPIVSIYEHPRRRRN